MWQVHYRCRRSDIHCYLVGKVLDRNPVLNAVQPPLCTEHNEPMVLQSYTNLNPFPQTDAKRRRKGDKVRGGQGDLDFSSTVR